MTAGAAGRLRVLLVEHDDADVELNIAALERGGFAVEPFVAATRTELLALLGDGPYDIVLADYRLPQWTGMEALRTIREVDPDLPFILVTGTLGDELAVECLKEGAADYVIKKNLARLPVAVRNALLDLSMRHEISSAMQEIREREERFRQLAENIDEVFFIADADLGRMLYINPAYEAIWGRTCASLYAAPRSFMDPVHPEDTGPLAEQIAAIQRGEHQPEIEVRVVQPDGQTRTILIRAYPILDQAGVVYRIAGRALDISERKRVKLQLKESEALFRQMLETSFDGIAIIEDGRIIDANRGYAQMFGYSVDELIGMDPTVLAADESLEEAKRRITERIDGTYTVIAKHKDGHDLICEATARTHMVAGKPRRLTAMRDLTEKRQLEEQFRQAQKMEAVGRLAGGVAHDFNNLLTVIAGCAELLREDFDPHDPRLEELQHISKAAGDASALTRQLLAFSRQQVIQPRLVVLEDVIANSEKILRRLIGEDIALTTELSAQPLTVMIDPAQLEQVIMNLAVNARDAMPAGGALVLQTRWEEVHGNFVRGHGHDTPGSFAIITVSDTGTGMDDKTQERIFEPFFTTKDVGKGTGLGLATVYGIVNQNHGFILVDSELGKGTSFSIYLPLAAEELAAEPLATPTAVLTGSETILVAEDSAPVRTLIRRILERNGYHVLEAPNGRFAMTLGERTHQHIHLLLTDLIMPEMSGRALAEHFRTALPDTRVLYMSGYDDDAIQRLGIQEEGTAFLNKPFSHEDLLKMVRGVLDG